MRIHRFSVIVFAQVILAVPAQDRSSHRLLQLQAMADISDIDINDVIYCEQCEMWLNGSPQWGDHKIGHKHKKNTPKHKKNTHKPGQERKGNTGEERTGIVIPEGTALIIEQTAIYNDAIQVYILSLLRRSLLRSRL